MKKYIKRVVAAGVVASAAISVVVLAEGSKHAAIAAVPYVIERVNLSDAEQQANQFTELDSTVSMSKNGRYAAFNSYATNLVTGDTNGKADIYVRDTVSGTTVRASVGPGGVQSADSIQYGKISGKGRYVVFAVRDGAFDSSDTNGKIDLYVRDLNTGAIELVSKSSSGALGNNHVRSEKFDISNDGRYVVFSSYATNLVSGDTNAKEDIFIRDRKSGTTTRLSVSAAGVQGDDTSWNPVISCEGSKVAFNSISTNLAAGATNGNVNSFIVDRTGGHIVTNITPGANYSSAINDISCDGSTTVYSSQASNLVANDTNGKVDAFSYDLNDNTTELVSVSTTGGQGDYGGSNATISDDGLVVAFESHSTNLDGTESGNADGDVFIRNRLSNTTERISKRNATTDMTVGVSVASSRISDDASKVAFVTTDAGLVSDDTNGFADVFVAQTGQ